uniref:C-Jun-amino-terminal kinase-interacting protein 4-like n=1 Tax=Hippocampus comes TaxID=109280 RepID=A0A3Q2YQ90_HIPCM
MRAREKERESRERRLEKKAREQADHVALEEQKSALGRELSTLRLAHNKLAHSYRELLEKRKDSERFVNDIISSTPETPARPDTKAPETSLQDELKEGKVEELTGGAKQEKSGEEEEELDEDSMEWELRNTDSVFSELSELSQDFVDSVDQGASIRSADQFEEILSQYEELKRTELVDTARKALINRVVELTDDRSALKLEVTSLRETAARVEGRMKEKEEELKRLREKLETFQSSDPDASLATSMRHFSRSEMARVVMEKNQYKQRLFELQEAMRQSQTLRATKEERLSEERRSSVWALSPRARRRELYREIRSHVWGTLGKRQLHGWSVPLANTQPEPQDVPVLTQLRLLDQRDCTAKCSVWVVSGPASSSAVSVIDPARPNTVLDQFSLPPTAPALCICAVPPVDSPGTVWIGTQEGIVIHAASADRGRCLHSVSLSESVHSLCSQGQVIAGLGDGTLAFFSSSSGWNLQSHSLMPLGSNPVQPIRCCLAKGGRLWVGYWNRVHVVDINRRKFPVSERSEQQVRFLCAGGSGVWTSCRLDSVLRLFDWSTGRPLQEVDFAALVTKSLLELSPLQISSLAVISSRLWVGTAGGAIVSIPLSISEAVSIPYCSVATAQLCYHGHRQAVRFIIAAPQLILSGGEGYINFRIDESDGSVELFQATLQRFERSHMIIWQNPSVPVPSAAL